MKQICPHCDSIFEVKLWENGKCPKCNKLYFWAVITMPDYEKYEFIGWED